MGLFSQKPRSRRPKRSMTADDKSRKLAEIMLRKRVEKDPTLERFYIKRFTDVELPEVTPMDEAKRKLESLVLQKAIQGIEDDPELARELYSDKARQILGIRGQPHQRHGDGGGEEYQGYAENPLEQAIEQIDTIDELRSRLGGGGGGKTGLFGLDPNGIVDLLKMVFSKGGNAGGNGGTPESLYIIEIDGQPRQVTETQYRMLLKSGRVRPVALLTTAKPPEKPGAKPEPKSDVRAETKTEVKETPKETVVPAPIAPAQEQIPTMTDLNKWLEQLNLAEISEALEKPPIDFVRDLAVGVSTGDDRAKFVTSFLMNVESPELMFAVLEQFRKHPEYGPYIKQLLTDEGKAWATEVINLIKSGSTGVDVSGDAEVDGNVGP